MSPEQATKRTEVKRAAVRKFQQRKARGKVIINLLAIAILIAAFATLNGCQEIQNPSATDNPSSGSNPAHGVGHISISNITVFDIKDTSITASWTSNVPATAVLQAYQPLTGQTLSSWPDDKLTLEHAVTVTGLSPSTSYKLTVISKDALGIEVKVAIERQYTTPAPGGRADIEVGDHGPDFSLISVTGKFVSSADFLGKRTMLVIWKLTCESCREELSHVDQFYNTINNSDLNLITISVLEKAELIASYTEGKGFTFPILLDSEGEIVEKFTVDKYPTNVLIDASGKITKIHEGPFESVAEIDAFTTGP